MPTSHSGPSLPAPSPEAQHHSAGLTQFIRREIVASGGHMDFARFMELALYAPAQGYYVAGAAKLGEAGDFITAPEISPLFGKTLAHQVGEILQKSGGNILELGGGSGALAADLLRELHRLDLLPQRYLMLDVSPQLSQRQRANTEQRVPELAGRIEWIAGLPEAFEGVVIANEVLDALPVHLIAWRHGEIFERGVGWDDGFVWSERTLPSGSLRDAAESKDVQGDYISEISLAVPAMVRTLSGMLRKGALLLIDYGFGQREYFHSQRSRGTLMCHYRHHAHDDPFFLPGLQDLTAHVDFTAVAQAGIDSGLALLGYTTQACFLVNCGIAQLLGQQSMDDVRTRIRLNGGVQKLLSPAEMGELFKVMALGRGVDGPLAGFVSGDKSRLL